MDLVSSNLNSLTSKVGIGDILCISQVFLGQDGVRDVEGNELPRLVYVSREKRPGFEHHKKAGAMNALVSFK